MPVFHIELHFLTLDDFLYFASFVREKEIEQHGCDVMRL